MKLTDYIEQRKHELDDMEKHWLAEMARGNPHYKTDEMDEGDWFEQELAFIQSR